MASKARNLGAAASVGGALSAAGGSGATLTVGTTAQRPVAPSNGTMRINSTTDQIEVYYNNTWLSISSVATSFTAEILAVAGGGSGGAGGGGGAGGLLYYGAESVTNRTSPNGSVQTLSRRTTYTVTIGAGGTVAGGANAGSVALQGTNTTIVGTGISITAIGGGAGGTSVTTYGGGVGGSGFKGANGGSGGGGGGNNIANSIVIPGGTGTGTITADRQGYNGGSCPSIDNSPSGGGGGAGGAGSSGSGGAGGAGGVGLQYSISGSATYYAGGGGGGGYRVSVGTGGAGGGGNGGIEFGSINSTPGAANTGGGGGGNQSGGFGGSGVVVIRYAAPTPYGTGGIISSIVNGSTTFQIHTFTTSGTFTV